MANEMQRGNLTGTAIMRIPISGTVNISGKQMKELRFMPYSEFPEEGREDVLYIDTDGNAMYYWDGTEYIALSGGGSGGTSNYNELSNKPSINDITLTGNKTSADLGLQPTISDIATIRSGAASGATAVQPSDMETALASKQDVIDDLSDIRTGAAAGETAVQPSALETALSGKQDVISDLADIRSGATAGNTALQLEDVDTLPTDGSSNPVSSDGTYNFVNSSIATNTAYFIGTFASVAELEAYTGTVTNNDYAFVTSTDSAGNTLYNRYKYNAATQTWSFEYAVNNTAFTAAQWAAIQSGMTSADKTKLDGIEQGANKTVIDASPTSGSSNAVSSGGVHTAISGKQDTISDLSDIRSGASAGATAVQPSALNDYQTKLSGTNKLDPSYIDYDASHRAVSDTEKSTWNGKQDAISDLNTIRSGAAAGATALQQSDVSSTYSASGTAPVNGTAVNAAIETLDVSSVGGSGKYISAISEENGKIASTPATFDTALSSSSTNSNAPTTKAVYDDQQRQETEIGVVANAGAKNLLNPADYIKNSAGGLTITETGTGTYKITGTPSETVDVFTTTSGTFNRMYGLQAGKSYTISGLPTGNGLLCRIDVSKNNSGSWDAQIISNLTLPRTFTVPSDATGLYIRYRVTISATIPAGGILLQPMIRPAEITDATYQPYALPNPTLTPAVIEQVDSGAKNLFQYNPVSVPEISYVINGDGSITVTANSPTTVRILVFGLVTNLKDGEKYTLSGISGGSYANSYGFAIATSDATGKVFLSDGYKDFIKTSEMYQLELVVRSGQSWTKTFYPMICTAQDWAVSQKFVQYCPTNRELYGGELQYEVSDVVDNLNATFVDKTNSRFKIYKYGRFCFADVSLKLNTNNLTGNDTITSTALPEKMRPEFDFYGVAVARDNGVWVSANMLSVPFIIGATNGSVILRTGTGHSSALYITATTVWCASNTIVST